MMNDGFEAGGNSEPDRSLEAAVRRVFDDLSRDEFGEPSVPLSGFLLQ